MREVIARVVDGSEFREFKSEYGKTVITVSLQIPTKMDLISRGSQRFTVTREYRFSPSLTPGLESSPIPESSSRRPP